MLIPWADDIPTAPVGQNVASEADFMSAGSLPGDAAVAKEAPASIEHVAAPATWHQLQLPHQRSAIPYSAVVKEVDGSFPFWPASGLPWSCNSFRRCQYRALVLLPLMLRQRIEKSQKKQQRQRQSYLWNAEGQRLSRKQLTAASSPPKAEIRAFVRA